MQFRDERLGCSSLSMGLPDGDTDVVNVAVSAYMALDPVFDFLNLEFSFSKFTTSFFKSLTDSSKFFSRGWSSKSVSSQSCPGDWPPKVFQERVSESSFTGQFFSGSLSTVVVGVGSPKIVNRRLSLGLSSRSCFRASFPKSFFRGRSLNGSLSKVVLGALVPKLLAGGCHWV